VLYSVAGYGFEGEKIRTDSTVTLCQDCGQVCALEMPGQCVGYEWKETLPNSVKGECTYYSRIDRAVEQDDRFVAVAKTQKQHSPSLPTEPSPAPSGHSPPALFSAWEMCNERFGLGGIGSTALQIATAHKLMGAEIRTDGGLKNCQDCAQRCVLQLPGKCKGYAFTATSADGNSGSCTYYSRLDGMAAGAENEVAVVLAEHVAGGQLILTD